MKLLKTLFTVSLGLLASSAAMGAGTVQEPMIEFHTNLYDLQADDNAFHITLGATENTYVDVDCGFGTVEAEIQQAYFDSESSSISGTSITCTVSKEGMVRIYGDPSKIDYLDFSGCYISDISFPGLTELRIINLEHNELEALDLSHMTKLQAIYLTDNSFSRSPLVIGADKPELTILEMSIIDNLDPSFNISDYPRLASFEAWSNKGLRVCDPTGCPELLRLSIDVTPVEKLDVSKNPKLLILNIAETRIPSIDLSANPELTELYCGHTGSVNNDVRLTELNLGRKEKLIRLYCADNLLTSLDISQCPALQSLGCAGNLLPSIDISACPDLFSVDIARNCMDFVTIPAERAGFNEYYYSQRPFTVDRSYPVGAQFDFSERLNRPESVTSATLYSVSESDLLNPVALDESYYTYDNGKITLLKECGDSLYFSFSNTALPVYPLTTGKFLVKNPDDYGKPSAAARFTLSSRVSSFVMSVGIAGATPGDAKTFYVDFGDGELTPFTASTPGVPLAPNVAGSRKGAGKVTVYVPEGEDLTALSIRDAVILNCDLSEARSLSELEIVNCNLPRIDLSWNRSLRSLDLSGNALTALDLTTTTGGYDKNVLTDINLSANRLESVEFNDHRTPLHIDVSSNRLTEFSLKSFSNLLSLDISDNQVDYLSLQDCEALKELNVAGNLLTELYLPDYTPLERLDLSRNNIKLPSLPAAGAVPTYVYAPQRPIVLPEKAPSVNLSSEWLEVDGMTTAYEWLRADGTPLTESQISGSKGRFTFHDSEIGMVYCLVTHPAFPAFTGDDAITTTRVEAAAMPANVFASFTTLDAGDASITLTAAREGTAVYVDWTGEGDLEQYVLAETYTVFPAVTKAGAKVKCYSYDENDGVTVFSLSAGRLSDIDVSSMKSLTAFTCLDAALPAGSISLPLASPVAELNLAGNAIRSIDLTPFASTLATLVLSDNPLGSIDLTPFKSLRLAHVANAGLTSVKTDNPLMWELNLMGNSLASVDLSGVPAMEQLWLSNNRLADVDVESLASLHVLYIDGNRFTFTTLPEIKSSYYLYNYLNQQPLAIEPVDRKVDLSSQARVGDFATTYTWYVDTPYYDEAGDLQGEALVEGTDYTIDNGVTTFLNPFSHIMCVMTNEAFPSLLLYTDFIDVMFSSIDEVAGGNDGADVRVWASGSDVRVLAAPATECALYGVSGVMLRSGMTSEADGSLTFSSLPAGIYIVRSGNVSAKVCVK